MASALQLPADAIPEDASTETLPEWDSLGHMGLMVAIETEFGVQLSTEAMMELLSIDAIEAYLRKQTTTAT